MVLTSSKESHGCGCNLILRRSKFHYRKVIPDDLRLGMGPTKTFHSFRHAIATVLAEADVRKTYRAAITGHKVEDQLDDTYTKRNIEKVYELATTKIDFCLDLDHFKRSKYVKGEG